VLYFSIQLMFNILTNNMYKLLTTKHETMKNTMKTMHAHEYYRVMYSNDH